jgi:hypothetical protein
MGLNQPAAMPGAARHAKPEWTGVHREPFSRRDVSARVAQHFPKAFRACLHEEGVPATACRFTNAEQPRRKNASGIQHQKVAGVQKARKIPEDMVGKAIGFPANHKQASRVAGLGGFLGDGTRRQVVMEE